ncbi:hypothetical protein [Fontivita pretiosa]|uniref:hypothetical protein n=1 Tax=Fontivita pretiosa TaxID=2989684 RepID=UPI003D16DDE9
MQLRFPVLGLLLVAVASTVSPGARVVLPGGMVNLPYQVQDNAGNQWMIYPGGWLRQQGPQPIYGQAANLIVNGQTPQSNQNQARLDEKTGEVVFDEMNCGGLMITRRIRVNRAEGYVRYIDIFRNPAGQQLVANVQLNSNFNYGLSASQLISDPRGKDRAIGFVGQTPVGRSIVQLFAGKGAKIVPALNAQPNNNVTQATVQLTIPAGKQVALLHLHGTAASQDAGSQFILTLRESQIVSDVPVELRKLIVNIVASQVVGEREVLRGELFDVIELRGGDQLKGTIIEPSYRLETFYGPIELAAERVVGLINVGQFKPRQLLVTVDGEVFGGTLGKDSVQLQLSSGQTTQVPLSQISRLGYRKRPGEPEEWKFDRPMIMLRSGERMMVAMPTAPIDVMTRYGLLKLRPESIAAVTFQSDQHGVHEIELTDGSHFAGLLPAERFDMQLVGTSAAQSVSFPAATVSRLQLAARSSEKAQPADDAPTLELSNQDLLVGSITGQLKLDTTFDTITINGPELRELSHAPEAGLDVQVTLWDQTTMSGQLHQPQITCALQSGIEITVPVALIERYSNPLPQPSATMVDRIKAIVAELSADDWRTRERAEAQLVSMGSGVISVLKELAPAQPPEAQQRIESVLKQLEKSRDAAGAGAAAPGAVIEQ